MNPQNHTRVESPERHNPNPFDFVPFADQPNLRSEAEFNQMGKPWSGYLELRIKALTPIHIVGAQENQGAENRFSSHYRQGGVPCIPAASIRGCLRAFMEALTNGWVSQATAEFPYNKGSRHRGYSTFKSNRAKDPDSAIDPAFKPRSGSLMDVASFLFGLVVEKEEGVESDHAELARKSRVWIEDAFFSSDQLSQSNHWLPDVQGEAFMGGAKPSASSWWYMRPLMVTQRTSNHGNISTAEFFGKQYRGRKFYFHQAPVLCLSEYDPDTGRWKYPKGFCRVNLEAIAPRQQTEIFRLYLNRVPSDLAALLMMCLFPGNMRHKLGYGKAYGYGSIAFQFINAYLREEDSAVLPMALNNQTELLSKYVNQSWDVRRSLDSQRGLIDRSALGSLAMILNWDNLVKEVPFTYPPFSAFFFQTAIQYDQFTAASQTLGRNPKAADIAEALYPRKRTIDFRLYQEKSNNWDKIQARKP